MASAPAGIVLPAEYAYPVAAVTSTFYLLFWQALKVAGARKRAGIPYPQAYAEQSQVADNKAAYVFNCKQRAHQNTLELWPIVVGGTLIAGLRYPVVAASLCGTWVLSRIIYTIGYSTGDPKKRNLGGINYLNLLSAIGLLGSSTAAVVSLIRAL
ncbi:membrane-associated proteins in eicosanoid and glutathione metabolism [Trametes polyzona]|nr:membrane-associated proteins in eicosanoid and glutathione metabolism [Trametes polyzona]